MASYKTHTAINLLFIPLLLFFFHRFLSKDLLLIGVGSYVYATLFMSPDLDLAHRIHPLSLRGLLSLPFLSYSSIFRHRGISHWPLIGSFTRMLWLLLWILLLFYLIQGAPCTPHQLIVFYHANTLPLICAAAGIALADFLHLLVDAFS